MRIESFKQVHQGVVVDGDDFGDDVEAAGGHDDVVGFVNGGDLVGDHAHVAVYANADQRFAAVAELQRIGDRDNLHDAGVLQSLDAPAHGRFGESDFFGDRAVGATAVELQADR